MAAPPQVASSFISVWVNDEQKQVPAGQSVGDLLDFLGVAADRVAIELDKSIVRKRDWQQTTVHSGARIEIVEFVGGG